MNPYFTGEVYWRPEPTLFFGQLASLERTRRGKLRLTFDALPKHWTIQSLRQDGGRELSPEYISSTLERMPFFHLKFTLDPRGVSSSMRSSIQSLLNGLRGNRHVLGRWFEISFKPTPLGIGVCYSSVSDNGTKGFIALIDPAPPELASHFSKFTPAVIKVNPGDVELNNALSGVPVPEAMAVLDVGQASSNVMLNDRGRPILYFDVGRVLKGHGIAASPRFGFCVCRPSGDPIPVLLSHWHDDHFIGTRYDADLFKCIWITPPAVTNKEMSYQNGILREKTKVLELPRDPFTFTFGAKNCYTLTKSEGNVNSPNQSGHALMVKSKGRYWLLPGDANYKDIGPAKNKKFTAVVASHHGGKFHGKEVPERASGYARLVYSYGPNNSHRHPAAASVVRHDTQWSHGSWNGAARPGEMEPGKECDVRATAVHGRLATPSRPAIATKHAGSVAVGWNDAPDVSKTSVLAKPCPTCKKSFHIRQS